MPVEEEKKNIYKEIIDPDYSLITKFKELSPGSYKHSNNVMLFCESIARDLDLDVDLLRASAMYHDIGKINNPKIFSENQNGENIHDKLDPKTSYQLITRHVGDGIIILLQIRDIPIKLLNIISQHHGNTVLKYFYDKAEIEESEKYRYKCSVPDTLEASILMIVDTVEATTRSLYNNGKINTPEDKKSVVENSIKRLIDDGQLDELKVGHLKRIKNVLIKELETMYHKREPYDDEEN